MFLEVIEPIFHHKNSSSFHVTVLHAYSIGRKLGRISIIYKKNDYSFVKYFFKYTCVVPAMVQGETPCEFVRRITSNV